MSMRTSALSTAAAALAIGLVATACGGSEADAGGDADTLTLGYFPNITHAPALVGVENGTFDEAYARLDPALAPMVPMALKEMGVQGKIAAHKLVLSHADVTPNNVLVDAAGKPKALVDFDDAAWCPELFDAAVMARSFAFRSDGQIDIGRLRSIWSLWQELNTRYAFDAFLSSLTYACLRMSLLVADAVDAGAQDWKKLDDTRRWQALTEIDK